MVTSRGRKHVAQGFSLVELLVVMFIIGLVVAITIPALGFARSLARKASTQSMISDLGQACSRFQTDNRRVPGYFSPREMGHADNVDLGFSGIDNVMLDLAGGIVPMTDASPTAVLVGPTATTKVKVDPDRVGIASGSNKNYWVPDPRFYETQTSASKVSSDPNHLKLKSVVDAFGQPLLFWASDETSLAPVTATTVAAFANESVGAQGQASSKFYWASNSAFLTATALGRKARDQQALSILGKNYPGITPALRTKYMTGILGNPGAIANPSDPQANWVPSIGRGKFVIQSAGADGIFVSTDDSGFKQNGGASGFGFSQNFPAGSSKAADIMSNFDDLLQSGGS